MIEQFCKDPIWSGEQELILNSSPDIIISGIAGSGKTLVACHLAINNAKESKVLFLVYTKALSAFVQNYLYSYNAQSVSVLYEYQWKKREYENYDLVIIDEFQDFSEKDIKYALSQAKKGAYIFGDEQQRIYETNYHKETTVTLNKLSQLTNFPVLKLTSQYRVSFETGCFVSSMFNVNIIRNAETRNNVPSIRHFESTQEEIQWLVEFLRDTKYSNIGILLKQNDGVVGNYHYNKAEVKQIYPGILELHKILDDAGVKHGYKYRSSENLLLNSKKRINILTYHSSKGLLFDCVILPFSSMKNDFYKSKVSYVAITRPTEALIITYSCIITSEYYSLENSNYYRGKIRIYSPVSDLSKEFWDRIFKRQ